MNSFSEKISALLDDNAPREAVLENVLRCAKLSRTSAQKPAQSTSWIPTSNSSISPRKSVCRRSYSAS
jgi:hypothetical protein